MRYKNAELFPMIENFINQYREKYAASSPAMNTYNKIALGNWNGCRGCFLLSQINDNFA